MAEIRPFRGLRFSPSAGKLQDLTAPPYDVLSQEERDEYALRNAHNVVHLTLPEQHSDDRSKYVKYARSAARLAEWRRDGALELEARPAFYRYRQTFSIPGSHDPLVRTAIIALIKTEPYEKGVVLPHEQTFPKHKEDRLRILEATRAHLECIYGLFEDPDAAIFQAIDAAPVASSVEIITDDAVKHVLEPIVDEAACAELERLLADKKVWIADGHHRYETACTFRAALGERDGQVAEDYMMMALSSMSDPGLVLLPTHRILENHPLNKEALRETLAQHFEIEEIQSRNVMDVLEKLGAEGKTVFGAVFEGGEGWVLTAKDPETLQAMIDGGGSKELNRLDVSVLHKVILEKLMDIEGYEGIAYTRDARHAIRAVDGGAPVAFLMNPPTVEDMRQVALGGEKMPQKSTYYYPKLLSGLVVWSLADFE